MSKADTGFNDDTKGLILARSLGYCEVMGEGCQHSLSEIHHRRPRGAGGTSREDTNSAANGLAVCRVCHQRCERQRRWARHHGFLVPQWADPADVPAWWRCRMERIPGRNTWRHVYVLLDDAGRMTHVVDGVPVDPYML